VRHGYTNLTDIDGQAVTKQYQGPDAARRAAREQAALRSFGAVVPVPALVSGTASETVTALVPGTPGQDLLDAGHAVTVLRACGALAGAVATLPRTGLPGDDEAPSPGLVRCHGDFGPQNMLLDPGSGEVTALLDWEMVDVGHPLRDLAWAEWIVRMHHTDRVDDLDALFEGYGARPTWADRQAQMVAACERLAAFVQDWPSADQREALALWRLRTRTTASWLE
jgi:aminoglycoside phosphotransferase